MGNTSAATGKTAVFIPTHNEGDALAHVLSQIPPTIGGYAPEIVVVDDCSTDESASIARRFTPHVIQFSENRGVGAATKEGLTFASFLPDVKYIIKLDGDGQHEPRFMHHVFAKLEDGFDLVICSRFHPCSNQSYTPLDRILLNMTFSEIVKKITRWHISDARSGYMGFHVSDMKEIVPSLIVERYGVPMELILRLWKKKPDGKVTEIAHPAAYGGASISKKLIGKYSSESLGEKGSRLQHAYEALLAVLEDMEVPRERILSANGFAKTW